MKIEQYNFTVVPDNPTKIYNGVNTITKISFTVKGKKWIHAKTIEDMTDPFQSRPVNEKKKIKDSYTVEQKMNKIVLTPIMAFPMSKQDNRTITVDGKEVKVLDDFFPVRRGRKPSKSVIKP